MEDFWIREQIYQKMGRYKNKLSNNILQQEIDLIKLVFSLFLLRILSASILASLDPDPHYEGLLGSGSEWNPMQKRITVFFRWNSVGRGGGIIK